jgi:hypothetical protein
VYSYLNGGVKRCDAARGAGEDVYSYLKGGVKRCVTARGAGEVRMYIPTSMAA